MKAVKGGISKNVNVITKTILIQCKNFLCLLNCELIDYLLLLETRKKLPANILLDAQKTKQKAFSNLLKY